MPFGYKEHSIRQRSFIPIIVYVFANDNRILHEVSILVLQSQLAYPITCILSLEF